MTADITTSGTIADRPQKGDPTVALALGGGGARGLAHIHVIETLDELGIVPRVIGGSSIGAIMGAAMAAGMRGAEIREYALATLGDPTAVASRLWSLRPATMREAMVGGLKLGQFDLERILKAFLPATVPADFADLAIPLKVIATDYYGQAEVVLERGDLYRALAASAALPAIFRPVRIDHRIMIDGGIVNPVPYEPLMEMADIVIGIDVVGSPEGDGTHMPTMIDSLYGSTQLMMQANIALRLKVRAPDILLRPPVNHFRVLDFLRAKEVLAASEGLKDELKRAVEQAVSARSTAR